MAPTTHQIADKTDSRKLTEFLCQQGQFLLPAEQGTAKLKKLSEWLAQEYPSAAESLLEGLTEMFTISDEAVHRNAIRPSRQRVTRPVFSRIPALGDSMMFVLTGDKERGGEPAQGAQAGTVVLDAEVGPREHRPKSLDASHLKLLPAPTLRQTKPIPPGLRALDRLRGCPSNSEWGPY